MSNFTEVETYRGVAILEKADPSEPPCPGCKYVVYINGDCDGADTIEEIKSIVRRKTPRPTPPSPGSQGPGGM